MQSKSAAISVSSEFSIISCAVKDTAKGFGVAEDLVAGSIQGVVPGPALMDDLSAESRFKTVKPGVGMIGVFHGETAPRS